MRMLLVVLMLFTAPAMAGEFLVSLEGQALNAKFRNPSTTLAPGSLSESGGDFAPTLRIGYAVNRWYGAIEISKPVERKASSGVSIVTGSGVGDTVTQEQATIRDSLSGLGAMIGYRLPFANYFFLDTFAGATAWKTETREGRSIRQSTYYKCGINVCLGAPVTLLDEQGGSSSSEIGGTFGTSIGFGDENLVVAVGVRHHTALKSTGAALSLNIRF